VDVVMSVAQPGAFSHSVFVLNAVQSVVSVQVGSDHAQPLWA
jgi:hypothetical protein